MKFLQEVLKQKALNGTDVDLLTIVFSKVLIGGYVEDEKGAHVVGLLFKEIIKLSRQNLAMSCPFLHQNNKFRV